MDFRKIIFFYPISLQNENYKSVKEAAGMKARKFLECKNTGQPSITITYTGNLPEKERLTKAKEFSMKARLKAGRRRDAAY